RRAIVTARFMPGARIVERDVAAELGVSRTPVREALSRLEREGLLTAVPGRQRSLLQVAPLTAREMRQASAATAVLEGIGASEATSQRKSDRLILANQLDSVLDSVAKEMAPEGGSFARALELDERFHRMLADDFLEPSMAACLESARSHVYRYVWMFSPKTGVTAARFKSEHAPIVAALRRGDAAAVRTALEGQWSGFAIRIAPFLEEAG
ncbi:MAG TPA: GntR family transcriptional regulator, partial [Gemmatimonadota bacterium]|nr:GntR family transcriptional regulator [Gemmatimonadota bacterium]